MKKRIAIGDYIFEHVGDSKFRTVKKKNKRAIAELKTELAFKEKRTRPPFIVAQTSVCDDTCNNGLYANKDFDVGSILFDYPGISCDWNTYDHLNEYLAKGICNVEHLCKEFNVHIVFSSSSNGKEQEPNWTAIYDSFVEYVFGSGDDVFVYWNIYDWSTGAAIGSHSEDYGLFCNEPSANDTFLNRQSLVHQHSVPNAKTFVDKNDGKIKFFALKRIRKGDEILLFYGPLYKRSYEINYSLESCGNWCHVACLLDHDAYKQYRCVLLNGVKLDDNDRNLMERHVKFVSIRQRVQISLML